MFCKHTQLLLHTHTQTYKNTANTCMYVWTSELVSIPKLACTCHQGVYVCVRVCRCVCVCFRVLHASPHFLLHLTRFYVCFHAPYFHVSLIIVIIFAGVQYLALKINKQTSKQTNKHGWRAKGFFVFSTQVVYIICMCMCLCIACALVCLLDFLQCTFASSECLPSSALARSIYYRSAVYSAVSYVVFSTPPSSALKMYFRSSRPHEKLWSL